MPKDLADQRKGLLLGRLARKDKDRNERFVDAPAFQSRIAHRLAVPNVRRPLRETLDAHDTL